MKLKYTKLITEYPVKWSKKIVEIRVLIRASYDKICMAKRKEICTVPGFEGYLWWQESQVSNYY